MSRFYIHHGLPCLLPKLAIYTIKFGQSKQGYNQELKGNSDAAVRF